jgi:hypothetical protein
MCESTDCGIHNRVDVERYEEEAEFIGRITYLGDWAVYTEDNQFLLPMMLMGKPTLPHMTLIIKVGEGTIGDVQEKETGLSGYVYDAWFAGDMDSARDIHEMAVYGVQSGLLRFDGPVSPQDIVERY